MSTPPTPHRYAGDAVNQDTRNETVTSHHFAENAGKKDTFQPCAPCVRDLRCRHRCNNKLTSSLTRQTDAYIVEECMYQAVVQ